MILYLVAREKSDYDYSLFEPLKIFLSKDRADSFLLEQVEQQKKDIKIFKKFITLRDKIYKRYKFDGDYQSYKKDTAEAEKDFAFKYTKEDFFSINEVEGDLLPLIED